MSANNNERYGVFLDFGKDNNKWIRFKIQVNKDGWYFPEVLYRDNGPANMRKTDVYISPTNVDPFTLQVMTVAPDANAGGVGTIKAKRCDESIYLAEGEYYLTFYTGSNDYVNDKGETPAHYLYLYHLALVEDDASIGILAPKAVVITKPEAAMKPLAVNDTVKLTARVLPINASQKIVSWKSSNTEVATVDSDGNVTAVGEGVTLITVTARDARSEAVVIQVGENAQVYAFNEVIKKYLEVDRGDDTIRRVDISTDSVFTSEGYLWQNTHPFGQGWRLVEKSSDSISTAYRGDSAQDDGDKDNTDPNYKYGLFLLSNNNDSYVRFEIDVEQDGEYATEIIQHLSMNASTTQGSRQTEIYISPIATPTEYLMHDAYYVGTTQLLSDTQRNTIVTDYGLNSQTFDSIQLKAGKYNLIIKSSGIIGRYIYLHAIALHRKGDFVAPSPVGVVFTNHADEVLYTSANATHNLNSMIHSLLSDQNVVWASDNTDVATVANGVITTKNVTEGTALITASSTVDGDIKGKVRVIIGQEAQPSYKYDFVGPIREIVTEEITDATNFNLFTEGYAGSYELANSYNGSAPWMLLDTTDEDSPYCSYTVSTHEQGYGLFVMNSTDVGETTQFKFKVLKDANYGAILNISNWSKGLDFEVYLAPAKATDPTSKRWLVANHEITKLENLTYGLELGELPLYAGEYILSIKSTKVNFVGTNGGLVSIHGLNLYRTGDIYYTIEGAQVRIEGQNAFGTFENQGIRFISTIYKSEFNVDSADVKEFGTVLFPKDFLNEDDDGSNLTVDYVGLNGATAACVPAKNRYLDTGDAVTFTAVLTGLKDTNYKRVFVARAYVILNDGTVLYGDTWTERSIYDVAKNGLDLEAAGEVTMSDKEKSALTAIVTTAK
ncbi:MAG: Ig-like domain-containing protein [Oscillospiraceae bacterium]|nr:Ig-like domain-containing protein [Oscillospiraceae bacterium]